jgi:hypothetical protein
MRRIYVGKKPTSISSGKTTHVFELAQSRAWRGVVTLSVGVGTLIKRPACLAVPPAALQRGALVTHEAFPARSLSRVSLDD